MAEVSDERREHDSLRIARLAPHSFTDIVFGLAVSIGSLILIQSQVATWEDFVWNVMLFGFSFFVIVLIWILFSRRISALPRELPFALSLNLALLFCVALEPYLFYLLMNPAVQSVLVFTSVGYALDVGVMFVILAVLSSYVLKEERQSRRDITVLHDFKRMRIEESVIATLFLLSAAPVFWIPTQIGHLRFAFWYASLLILFASHILSKNCGTNQ